MQGLDVAIQHLVLVELSDKLGLACTAILWSPFLDLTKTDFVQALLNFDLGLINFLLAFLLGLSYDKQDLWKDECQL